MFSTLISFQQTDVHENDDTVDEGAAGGDPEDSKSLFTNKTQAIVWGMQNRAVQGMLDFDHVCSRKTPSVVAMTYPLM